MTEFLQSPSAIWILGGAGALSVFLLIFSFVSGAQGIVKEAETVSADRQGLLRYIPPILRSLKLVTILSQTKGLNKYRKDLPSMMIKAGLEGFMVAEEYIAFHLLAALSPIPVMAYLSFVLLGWNMTTFVVS